MGYPSSGAFWSYARQDDKNVRAAICRLAALISEEYEVLRRKELAIFVDHDIKWGKQWRERIDNALVATTFFIPIVSPTYFARRQCRRELFAFHRQPKALGVTELMSDSVRAG